MQIYYKQSYIFHTVILVNFDHYGLELTKTQSSLYQKITLLKTNKMKIYVTVIL